MSHPLHTRRRGAGAQAVSRRVSLRRALLAACEYQLRRWPVPLEQKEWEDAAIDTVALAESMLDETAYSDDELTGMLTAFENWRVDRTPRQLLTGAIAYSFLAVPDFALTGVPYDDARSLDEALARFPFGAASARMLAAQVPHAAETFPLDVDCLWLDMQVSRHGLTPESEVMAVKLITALRHAGWGFGRDVSFQTVFDTFQTLH
jgi:hypothetical protein